MWTQIDFSQKWTKIGWFGCLKRSGWPSTSILIGWPHPSCQKPNGAPVIQNSCFKWICHGIGEGTSFPPIIRPSLAYSPFRPIFETSVVVTFGLKKPNLLYWLTGDNNLQNFDLKIKQELLLRLFLAIFWQHQSKSDHSFISNTVWRKRLHSIHHPFRNHCTFLY